MRLPRSPKEQIVRNEVQDRKPLTIGYWFSEDSKEDSAQNQIRVQRYCFFLTWQWVVPDCVRYWSGLRAIKPLVTSVTTVTSVTQRVFFSENCGIYSSLIIYYIIKIIFPIKKARGNRGNPGNPGNRGNRKPFSLRPWNAPWRLERPQGYWNARSANGTGFCLWLPQIHTFLFK